MDVVHIRYDRCPYAQRPNFKGKEGYPTVAYQFHVGHNYEIFWMSPEGFPGARNDKTIVMYDKFLERLKSDVEFVDHEYRIYVGPGQTETKRGLHSLCDGGYHRWLHTLCGYKHADNIDEKAWSKLCESIRKDVECVFGIMKKRFRILAVPFLDHETKKLDLTMKVTAILHNMCTRETGLDNIGQEARHWKRVDRLEAARYGLNLQDLNVHMIGRQGLHEEETLIDVGYEEKRQALVRHYAHAVQAGEVYKMRTAFDILVDLDQIDAEETLQ